MSPGPCKDCRGRFVGCHGRTAEGAWRCEAWGRWQEERAGALEQSAGARFAARLRQDYISESKERFRKRKEQGKPKRG